LTIGSIANVIPGLDLVAYFSAEIRDLGLLMHRKAHTVANHIADNVEAVIFNMV
jgi:hypothetical protein